LKRATVYHDDFHAERVNEKELEVVVNGGGSRRKMTITFASNVTLYTVLKEHWKHKKEVLHLSSSEILMTYFIKFY